MQSTEKLQITTNKVYEIIKNFYSKNFPYPTKFNAIDAINLSFSDNTYDRCVRGRLEKNENNIPVYIGEHNLYTPVFKDQNVCIGFVQDVNTLHAWLVKNSYIIDEVATEKFTLTKNLYF
ncbi:hypothetical protein [Yersinia ruckeri]|uniref:hypothetical protein n=1 Tax=Yersinia ruckeri TaxID=29486 RepID=UPI001F21E0E6|nr:hypothetical protein [Yersinia ruckeri]UIN02286.1 hypothetical protein LGL91_08180 [Yersinia ruckeri]